MSEERPPSWFTGAVANRPESHSVEVQDCHINYLCWGDPNDPGLVLIHGGAAHAYWWSFIAPQFTATRAARYFVVAVDLSGHGESGHRDGYSVETWTAEIMAVIDHSGMRPRPTVVGHSMGGHIALQIAAEHGDSLEGAIIVDTPVRRPDPETLASSNGRMFKRPKTYPDLRTAMDHFHLVPPQPVLNPYIVEHIAHHSLRETDGQWTWKFDPRLFERSAAVDSSIALKRVTCQLAVIHGQLSALLTEDVQIHIEELVGRSAPMIEIPQAYHHILLDQPLPLIAAIRSIVGTWSSQLHPEAAGN